MEQLRMGRWQNWWWMLLQSDRFNLWSLSFYPHETSLMLCIKMQQIMFNHMKAQLEMWPRLIEDGWWSDRPNHLWRWLMTHCDHIKYKCKCHCTDTDICFCVHIDDSMIDSSNLETVHARRLKETCLITDYTSILCHRSVKRCIIQQNCMKNGQYGWKMNDK